MQIGSRVMSKRAAGIVPAACALLLAACAGLDGMYSPLIAETDYWNTGLSLAQHIDVAALVDADSGRPAALSGFVSAVAVQGNVGEHPLLLAARPRLATRIAGHRQRPSQHQ